jgi:hypothetical protein
MTRLLFAQPDYIISEKPGVLSQKEKEARASAIE